MSYLALARKWRPQTFSQLVGQEHINKLLINSFNQQRIHHAYLFTGTRGVGKTSVARLVAKALNCEQGITATPCLQCQACLAVQQGHFIDLIEIDGASKTRVEDTRDLLENVQYAPAIGRYKIYLIDEVHMLSQHSFNALLKTLEEPPSHVKFLLATTEPQKLPITVLSRCLQLHLRHLPADIIVAHLKHILQEEGVSFENEALTILANAAQGSMRDALSLLDQAMVYCDNILSAAELKTLLGYTQKDYALQLLHALANFDAIQIMRINREITAEGGHFDYVLNELLSYLHQITLGQHLPNQSQLHLVGNSSEIEPLSKKLSQEDTQLFYQIALKGKEDMHLAPTLFIGFEMLLLRMITFKPALPSTTPPLAFEMEAKPSSQEAPSVQIIASSNEKTFPQEANETHAPHQWEIILPQLKLKGLAQTAAENAEMIEKTDHNVVLRISKGHQSLFTATILQRIEKALTQFYNESIQVKLHFGDDVPQASPAQKKHAEKNLLQQEAEKSIESDLFIQQLQREFSAELLKHSIEPL